MISCMFVCVPAYCQALPEQSDCRVEAVRAEKKIIWSKVSGTKEAGTVIRIIPST